MTQRERTMATVLGSIVVLGMAGGGVYLFASKYFDGQRQIEDARKKIADASEQIKKVETAEETTLKNWRRLSLPGDLNIAGREYRLELLKLLNKHKFVELYLPDEQAHTVSTIVHPAKQGKIPLWTGINYLIRFRAPLANLADFLVEFQQMPRMHRIKTMTVERPEDKSAGRLLTVQMTVEGLSILDAEEGSKKTSGTSAKLRSLSMAMDVMSALRGMPTGLANLGWWLTPQGDYVSPLNPPKLEVRSYGDIGRKSLFGGREEEIKTITTTPPPPPPPPAPSERDINLMEFNRLVSLTSDDTGKLEARLWNMYHNQTQRLRAAGGFRTFKLVQNAKGTAIVHGEVARIESSELIFRVVLDAASSKSPKWWRYGEDDNYYNVHEDDFAKLLKDGKVEEGDEERTFLVSAAYWEKLTVGKVDKVTPKIELYRDGKNFRYVSDFTRGEIVYAESEVVFIRLGSFDSELPRKAKEPGVAVDRYYPDPETIYRIGTKHLLDLIKTEQVKDGDGNRLFVIHTSYWDLLTHEGIVKPQTSSKVFTMYKDLIKGDIISRSSELVVFRLDPKYCRCPGDYDLGTADRYHEGFCILKIGDMVQDALKLPVPDAQVKELLK